MAQKITSWHRRQAMQLAIQLPEELEDAEKIVDCVSRLLRFLYPSTQKAGAPGQHQARLLDFPAGGSKRPRRRASSKGSASVLPK